MIDTREYHIIPIPTGADKPLQAAINNLNTVLMFIQEAQAKHRGLDGNTPTFSANIDMQGNRITNIGQAAEETEVARLDQASFSATNVLGTLNEIKVTQNAGGTVTIGGYGYNGTFTCITQIQAGGGGAIGIQYKDRTITLSNGIVSSIGTESGWNDL